ncbi:DUF4270 domain-containing protein [Flavobacterium sp. NG2]|uniref:DUF4270 domain-containing protein n=1 Tax=Flavobacterium sp. NG2 TaxID=3097547 RepID=UPI002A82BA1F|nr:DUF4270 domain-containing protein [Flavobacterium sp. NG2]WPR72109.1 DUF4270 domain-containing protein [Flavobacterium sp. NG2]
MYNISFFKRVLFICSVVLVYSCDKDYNSIGDSLVGGSHFDFDKYTSNVVVYNQKISAIQSNNQAVNPLGIYENPDFGTTTANFVTQVSLSSVNPTVINPVTATVESVVLSIPYFVDATQTVTNTDGTHTYVLDSIYGSSAGKMKLSVFRSGYYLRNLDPIGGFVDAQKYYTDQNSVFSTAKIGTRLNTDAAVSQNDEFFFDNSEEATTTTVDGVTTTTYAAPAMRLKLNASYFKTAIIDAVASGKLISNDVFRDYFRGLYFQVEKSGTSPANLAMLNFAGGTITIKYKDETSATDNTMIERSIVLNLTGNTVSLLEQSDTKAAYTDAINSSNSTTGDSKLFVKGGEGSMAVLKLFEDGDLATIKNNGWLINEANLIFHVDKTTFTGTYEPQRLYLYDLNNNRPLVDYYDTSTGTTAKNGKTIYGGILAKDASGNSYYKFRITNHVRNLIQKDSTNIKLGLVVTEAISNITSVKLKTATPITTISQAPQASVMNPLGTILFGNNIPVSDPNYDKRLKLEIYYTKPN